MNTLGYEKNKERPNGFEKKFDEGTTLGIVFNYPNKTAYGVIMFPHLIKSQSRLDKLQNAYNLLQSDLKRVEAVGVKVLWKE